jgi:hypothetical protein
VLVRLPNGINWPHLETSLVRSVFVRMRFSPTTPARTFHCTRMHRSRARFIGLVASCQSRS